MPSIFLFIAISVATLASLGGTYLVRHYALRKQLMDIPNLALTLRLDRGCQCTAENFVQSASKFGLLVEFCDVQAPNQKPFVEAFFQTSSVRRSTEISIKTLFKHSVLGNRISPGTTKKDPILPLAF